MENSRIETLASLGPAMQIAYVPEDFDGALHYWTTVMGVGPFFVREHVALGKVLYRGKETPIDFDMAIGYWGNIQIELIRQNNDAPSIYNAWKRAGHTGVQHICVVVDDMRKARAKIEALGLRIEQELLMTDGGSAIYVDTGGGPGTMIEYIHLMPERLAGFAAMRAASIGWDGTDPIRRR